MDYTEKAVRRISRYEGIIVNLQVDQVALANGRTSLREVVERAEKAQIQAVLKLCAGDVTRAAERLGIHRSALYKKISKYQLRHRPTYDFE